MKKNTSAEAYFQEFGKRLRKVISPLCKKENGGVTGAAKKLNIDKTVLNRIMSVERIPSLHNVARILASMPEINARWLITGYKENETKCQTTIKSN